MGELLPTLKQLAMDMHCRYITFIHRDTDTDLYKRALRSRQIHTVTKTVPCVKTQRQTCAKVKEQRAAVSTEARFSTLHDACVIRGHHATVREVLTVHRQRHTKAIEKATDRRSIGGDSGRYPLPTY